MLQRRSTHSLTEVLRRIVLGRTFQDELMNQPDANTDLTRAMLDAVGLFEALEIDYALVGGIAAMVYGRSRFTEDVDFVAAQNHEQRMAENPDTMKQYHFDPGCTWKLYHDSGAAIDLWKDEFVEGIVARSHHVTLAGQQVRVADAHDLIAMKLRADRPQDDYDISEILKHQTIDDAAIQQYVTDTQFEAYQRIKSRIERAR